MKNTAIIFDLDGTLVDTVSGIRYAISETVYGKGEQQFTLPITAGFIGRGIPNLVRSAFEHADVSPPDWDAAISKFEEALLLHQQSGSVLYDGVSTCLQSLSKSGYPLAICTNKSRAAALAVLKNLSVDEMFGAIVCGDDVTSRKPNPAPLFKCEQILGVKNSMYVGDSETDEETALSARRAFILHTDGYRKKPVSEFMAQATFSNFRELLTIVHDLDE